MKKNFKKLLILTSTFTLMSASTLISHAGWQLDHVGWWYQNADGTYPVNTWCWIDGNGDSIAECYYFDTVGYCLLNTVTPDGYIVDANGAWIENGIVQTQAVAPTIIQPPVATQVQSADEAYVPAEVTLGMKNALSSANSYLDILSFSYQALIEQLEYEKYSHEEAVYAANNCGANWYEQALDSAKSYLDIMSFSYPELVEQLLYEKYTYDQAVYAVNNCGADWYEQAVKSASSYLSIFSFSRSELIEQLEYEGFTHEQAVYGVTQNGY